MRYSYTTLALAIATANQVIAQPSRHAARHGHAVFHKKELEVPEKRTINWAEALGDVNWSSALQNVDWATVSYTYSSDQNWGESTGAPVAPATPSTAVAPVATTTEVPAVPVVTSPASAPEVTATAAPTTSTTAVAAAVTTPAVSSSSSSSSGSSVASSALSDAEEAALQAFGVVSQGFNAVSSAQDVWIGNDGPYTMDIVNSAGEGLYLVCWGPSGSWINVDTPLVTQYIAPGATTTLSFANGASGALSAFYSDTKLVNGQMAETWIEFTMSNDGVFDISREVNMQGHTVEVVGPSCTSNMSTCVFQCTDTSVSSCEFDYELVNCANGSQSGAQFGTFDGADSGGCGGLGSSAAMTATFS